MHVCMKEDAAIMVEFKSNQNSYIANTKSTLESNKTIDTIVQNENKNQPRKSLLLERKKEKWKCSNWENALKQYIRSTQKK